MTAKLSSVGVVLLAALALGVAGAGGGSLATTTTVRVEVVGVGTVTDNKNGVSCGNGHTTCRISYSGTGIATFTETPAIGWTFSSWGGACGGATCTVTLDLADDDHEVIANFASLGAGTNTLTVTATGDNAGDGGNVSGGEIDCDTGDTDCSWDVFTGSVVTLVETPEPGFVFGGWSGGSCSGTARSCTVTMDGDRTVNVTFTPGASTFALSVTVTGNGTVTGGGIACTAAGGAGCTQNEPANSQVTLTATAGSGAGFTGWAGACGGSSTTCTVTMNAAKSVTAAFTGGAGTTYPLSVSVTGNGSVTGTGINCGAGGSDCTQNEVAGSSITLTATPASGSTFTGWGGACSGTGHTCTVTMNSAKNVTATFSGGSTTELLLSVSVNGPGRVTGGGITCGSGSKTCSAKQTQGSTVGLTASPAGGAVFAGWGGACKGTAPSCTVEMDAAKSVSARFTTSPGAPSTPSGVLRSRGRPIVKRTPTGFEVTLRFSTSLRGRVHLRGLRAGRLETALTFTAAPGPATVGPFPLSKPGFYTFELVLGGRILRWGACLGRCGEAAASEPFTLVRRTATAVDAGALWSLTLHFRSTQQAGIDLRVYRGGRLAREVRFAAPPGSVTPGALLLSPGTYTLRLIATDAFGRVRKLTWIALLP